MQFEGIACSGVLKGGKAHIQTVTSFVYSNSIFPYTCTVLKVSYECRSAGINPKVRNVIETNQQGQRVAKAL